MTTFTLRVSNSLADRLSSAQMRAWIEEFVCQWRARKYHQGLCSVRIAESQRAGCRAAASWRIFLAIYKYAN